SGWRVQVATIVHAVVENADNQHAGLVGLEEDAVTAAGGHLHGRPEIIASARHHRASEQALHRGAKGVHVLRGLISSPSSRGVPPNRCEVRPRNLGENESLHRLANRASIWSSVSSSITRPAETS